MNIRYKFATYIIVGLPLFLLLSCNTNLDNYQEMGRKANIFPDYSNLVLPQNIAPINFKINDSLSHAIVVFANEAEFEFRVKVKNKVVDIPMSKWKKLCETDGEITLDIYFNQDGSWRHFDQIVNQITADKLDSYLVYRFINPANIIWNKMGIFQRELSSFDVTPIMTNDLTEQNCMHCHSFAANNANNFMLHMRGKPGGTVIYTQEKLKFVNTKTEYTMSPGGYPSWHPSGKYIAFSTNKIHQKFHAAKDKYAFVYDEKSDIVLYDVERNEIQAVEALNKKEFENMPTWSPDGKYLYFLSSDYYDSKTVQYENIKYDLKRIPFNLETKKWGSIEALISSKKIGKSVAFPRVSFDNRYVVMCLSDYGYFTVYNETSDIAILDLKSLELIIPDINSDGVESYPSWSSNGKWIMFNSKRADGISSRPYFSYFEDGKAHKPFILPQEDPNWNIIEMFNINRPELVDSKVSFNPQDILKLVQTKPEKVKFDLNTLEYLKGSELEKTEEKAYEFIQ